MSMLLLDVGNAVDSGGTPPAPTGLSVSGDFLHTTVSWTDPTGSLTSVNLYQVVAGSNVLIQNSITPGTQTFSFYNGAAQNSGTPVVLPGQQTFAVAGVNSIGTGTAATVTGSLSAPANMTGAWTELPAFSPATGLTAIWTYSGSSTTISAVASTGSQTVTPASMTGISVGSYLLIDSAVASAEIVLVTGTTGTTFTAVFANTHSASTYAIVVTPAQTGNSIIAVSPFCGVGGLAIQETTGNAPTLSSSNGGGAAFSASVASRFNLQEFILGASSPFTCYFAGYRFAATENYIPFGSSIDNSTIMHFNNQNVFVLGSGTSNNQSITSISGLVRYRIRRDSANKLWVKINSASEVQMTGNGSTFSAAVNLNQIGASSSNGYANGSTSNNYAAQLVYNADLVTLGTNTEPEAWLSANGF